MTEVKEIIYATVNAIAISCVQDDGTTPLNMNGGSIELIVQRAGLKPFYVRSTDVTWTDRTNGKGKVRVDLSGADPGYISYQLKSITSTGDEDVQTTGLWRITRSLPLPLPDVDETGEVELSE